MAWETGTATDHNDLLVKLGTFLSTNADLVAAGQNWDIVFSGDSYPSDNVNYQRYLGVKGPGSTAGDAVYAFIICRTPSADIAPNWYLYGAKFLDTAANFPEEPTRWGPQAFSLTNQGMTYWFFANGRRFVVVAKIGSGYYSCHMGWGLPFATPTEYPYPYYFAGNFTYSVWRNYSYTESSVKNSSFHAPVTSSQNDASSSHPGMCDHMGAWREVNCRYESSGNAQPAASAREGAALMWPSCAIQSHITSSQYLYQMAVSSNADGSPSVTPIYFVDQLCAGNTISNRLENYAGLFFQLDEIYLIGHDSPLVPESEVVIDGKTYIIFSNGTNQNRGESWCILKG